MFQLTKNVAEFFYDLVTPHQLLNNSSSNAASLTSTAATTALLLNNNNNENLSMIRNRNNRYRRHPNDLREGLKNAYYVLYEGINDKAANLVNEITNGSKHNGRRGAFGGALRQLPSAAFVPILLAIFYS